MSQCAECELMRVKIEQLQTTISTLTAAMNRMRQDTIDSVQYDPCQRISNILATITQKPKEEA